MVRLTRRNFLKAGIAVGAATLGVSAYKYAPGILSARNRDERPNVLWITMDTTRYDRLGFNGYTRDTTPNLDKYAEQGVVFHKNYSQAPVTIPSIPSFLTSKYPKNLSLATFFDQMPTNVLTAAQIFRSLGYNTSAATSVSFLNRDFLGKGFDYFSSPMLGSKDRDDFKNPLAKLHALLNIRNGEETNYALIDTAKNSDPDKPNFYWVHYFDAHFPYTAPEGFKFKFAKNKSFENGKKHIYNLRSITKLINDEEANFLSDQYDGQIFYVDYHIGKLLKTLEAAGKFDLNKDLLVFNADHGDLLGEHGYYASHHSAYEEITHVPFMITGAGLSRGKNLETLTANLDILPTILHIIGGNSGVNIPKFRFDGRSLVDVINGNQTKARDFVLTDLANFEGCAVRDDKFVYIRRLDPEEVTLSPKIDGFAPQGSIDFDEEAYKEEFRISWPEVNTQGLPKNTLFSNIKISGSDFGGGQPFIVDVPYSGNSVNMFLICPFFGEDKWNLGAVIGKSRWSVRVLSKDNGNERVIFNSDNYGNLEFKLNPTPRFTELYDHTSDPKERTNLIGAPEFGNVRDKMQEALQNYYDDLIKKKISYNPPKPKEDQKEQLKALGYV